jgi:translation initiation factor 1
MDRGRRPVYSTERGGRLCPKCGWPADDCRCASNLEQAVPERPGAIVAKLRIEKSGRGGKTVTVVDGLPRNAGFLDELARELKRALGTGGTAREEGVEIQGDRRERLRELLRARGFTVKG